MREHVVLSRFDSATVDEGRSAVESNRPLPRSAGAVYLLHRARPLKPPGSGDRGMGSWRLLMFFNISNHPSSRWSYEQLMAARTLGGGRNEVQDIPFPAVPPTASELEVEELARGLLTPLVHRQQWEDEDDVFMVQGEYSLTYLMTRLLLSEGRKVVVACTERKVQERTLEGGKVEKTSTFEFVRFRLVVDPSYFRR
jgi:hypothetical protein